jgi:hypothetical protein
MIDDGYSGMDEDGYSMGPTVYAYGFIHEGNAFFLPLCSTAKGAKNFLAWHTAFVIKAAQKARLGFSRTEIARVMKDAYEI